MLIISCNFNDEPLATLVFFFVKYKNVFKVYFILFLLILNSLHSFTNYLISA